MDVLQKRKRKLHRRASCANNLKPIGLSLKLARVSILVLGIATFLPLAVRSQSSDGTDRFLLQVAAPNRTVGSDDRPNVLFMIFDDLNVAQGDWLALRKTPIEFIDAVYFAYTAELMAEMAEVIGKKDDAQMYVDWGRQICRFFNRNYVNDDGSLAVNTQTACALALSVDMLPPAKSKLAAQHLVTLIEENGHLLSTGLIGKRWLMPVLSDTGNHDLAVRLLQNRRYPSWGFSVVNGATTVWERWNSYTKEGGISDAKMKSFCNYGFGTVCEWMFKMLVGIDTSGAGYGHIVLRPGPPGADSNPDHDPIHWVKTEYDSIRGKITVDWKQNSSSFEYKVTIPANTNATLYLPASSADLVTESGNRLNEANGVQLRGMEGTRVKFALDSGTYRFVAENEPRPQRTSRIRAFADSDRLRGRTMVWPSGPRMRCDEACCGAVLPEVSQKTV